MFSCDTMIALGATATGGNVTPTILASAGSSAIFSLPPACSGSILVSMMNLIGLGGAGELMVALSDGLVQPPGVCEQCNPTQRVGAVDAVTDFCNSSTVDMIFGVISAGPASTSSTPSLPTDAAMLPQGPTSM